MRARRLTSGVAISLIVGILSCVGLADTGRAAELIPPAAVQTLLNFATHPTAKTASPEQFIDNSILAELDRSGFIEGLYRK